MSTETKPKRTPNAAFMKALTPSKELAAVIGSTPMPRTQVTSRLWEYIKENNLQDPNDKRTIVADAKLKPVFGTDRLTMFQMASAVSKHLS